MGNVRRLWSQLPPKSRVLFALAATLVCVGAGLLGEELYFRANAVRVEGVVVGHDRKGRPIVEYQWGGQSRRYETRVPTHGLAVGTEVGVHVPTDGSLAARLDNLASLLFTPGWLCIMPATFFAAYGVVVAVWGARRGAEPGAAPDRSGTSASQDS
jgi:hypothetical protein